MSVNLNCFQKKCDIANAIIKENRVWFRTSNGQGSFRSLKHVLPKWKNIKILHSFGNNAFPEVAVKLTSRSIIKSKANFNTNKWQWEEQQIILHATKLI